LGKRFVEISTELDHGRAESAHGGVLVHRVAMWDVDRRCDARPGRRERDGLTMIAARRRDDPGYCGLRALQIVHVDDPATDLEGAGRRVVLVLHPHFAPGALGKEWPGVLRRWRDGAVDELGCSFQIGKAEQRSWRAHHRPPVAGAVLPVRS